MPSQPPSGTRNHTVDPTTFKVLLDIYLTEVPDQPNSQDATPEALTISEVHSNSLKDWPNHLKDLSSWTLLLESYNSLCD